MPRFSDCWRCGNTVGVGIICQLCDVAKYCSEKCQRNDIFRHEAECIPASILKTCTACRKSGQNLKSCTGCYRAFYCDANCQRSNWERHKIDCLAVKENIETIATRLAVKYFLPFRQMASAGDFCYWGNVPAFDCLNLIENEGSSYGSALKVLLLGVGDLRDVALTCASLPESYENKISFTLTDRGSCGLARLVLFLYMLKKGDLGIEKAITEIWYSIQLSESTYQFLRSALEQLGNFTSAEHLQSETAGLISVHEMQFKQLQEVWKGWLGLRVQGTKWIQKQRARVMNSNFEYIARSHRYIENIPTEHANAAKKWIDDGVFKRTHEAPAFAENPTLTGVDLASRYDPYAYSLPPEVFPFSGWDYLQVKKFKSSSCLVTMYGDYIECVLRMFIKMLSKQQVSFKVVLSDWVNIQQHLEMDTVYDRILTSNLMDYVFLPDLLKLCSKMLNHDNHHATIVTGTILWAQDIIPEGDVGSPANQPRIPMLLKIAVEDTKRSSFGEDVLSSLREYLENSCEFFDYLRALFYAKLSRKAPGNNGSTKDKPSTIPVTKDLGNEFQLRLRDGIRNENRIVFFRPAINRRRVTIVTGMERYLEWVPLQKK